MHIAELVQSLTSGVVQLGCSMAGSARSASVRVAVGILFVVRMPLGAVSFVGREQRRAHQVFPHGHWLQVRRIHAMAYAAQVVDGQPIRDFTDRQLVRKSMAASVMKSAVPALVEVSLPEPTSVENVRSLINQFPESIGKWLGLWAASHVAPPVRSVAQSCI